jgi:hypothetical protein
MWAFIVREHAVKMAIRAVHSALGDQARLEDIPNIGVLLQQRPVRIASPKSWKNRFLVR